MSRHLYCTTHQGKPVTVALGFDRPLQGFFLTVGTGDGAEADVYCNLDDPVLFPWGGLPPTLDPLLRQLRRLQICVPFAMVEEVRRDQRHNVGNRIEFYSDDAQPVCEVSELAGECDPQLVESAMRAAIDAFGPQRFDPPDCDVVTFTWRSERYSVKQVRPGSFEISDSDHRVIAKVTRRLHAPNGSTGH